jgi:hypothetical protein
MKTATGFAALVLIVWATLMGGWTRYTFPHRFARDIDSPVLALELARDRTELGLATQGQKPEAVDALTRNTRFDLILIPLYAIFLLLLASLFGVNGWVAAALILVAVAGDYVEDVLMFRSLNGLSPGQFAPSVVKWSLLAVVIGLIGARMITGSARVYAFATEALLGLVHVVAAVLMLLALAFGTWIGYSWLELGTALFAITVPVHAMAMLGPVFGKMLPAQDIVEVPDYCQKRAMGLRGPAVRAEPQPPSA